MPRKHLIRTPDFPYHVTSRANNKEFFYLEREDLWIICLEVLKEIKDRFGVQIHVFVLMSNHYHLIISTPKSNLGNAMKYFHREVARKSNKKVGRINHFWGGRYKWSLIDYELYYWNAVKYVFRNPVAAGICSLVEEYKYSSLNTMPEDFNWNMSDFFFDRNKQIDLDLDWLNLKFERDQSDAISKGLRRRQFTISSDKSGRIPYLHAMHKKKGTVT